MKYYKAIEHDMFEGSELETDPKPYMILVEHHDEYLVLRFQIDDTGHGLPQDIIDKFNNHQGNALDLKARGLKKRNFGLPSHCSISTC